MTGSIADARPRVPEGWPVSRRSTIALGIRKVQFAPSKPGPQPCTVVRKDFVLSPGQLELELTLDRQLYLHGEAVAVNVCVRNHSNKVVKRIKAAVQQGVDVVLFQNGQYRNVVASVETQSVLRRAGVASAKTEPQSEKRGPMVYSLENQHMNYENRRCPIFLQKNI